MVGKTDPFTQFYPTGFTQWVKPTVPTLLTTYCGTQSWFWNCLFAFLDLYYTTLWVRKNWATFIFTITLANVDRILSLLDS